MRYVNGRPCTPQCLITRTIAVKQIVRIRNLRIDITVVLYFRITRGIRAGVARTLHRNIGRAGYHRRLIIFRLHIYRGRIRIFTKILNRINKVILPANGITRIEHKTAVFIDLNRSRGKIRMTRDDKGITYVVLQNIPFDHPPLFNGIKIVNRFQFGSLYLNINDRLCFIIAFVAYFILKIK